MANNLTAAIDSIHAKGLVAMRENSIVPRLVNRAYEATAGTKGTPITITLPYAVTSYDVVPGPVPPAGADITPTQLTITMDNWKANSFHLTDKEVGEVNSEYVGLQVTENIKELCNAIDVFCLETMYKSTYNWVGTEATTPFAAISEVKDIRVLLSKSLCPVGERRMVLDPDAYGNATILEQLSSLDYVSDYQAMMDGQIGYRQGFAWFEDQNVPTCALTTASGYVANGVHALNATTITLKTGSGTISEGEVLTFAGDTQTYVVRTGIASAGDMVISPGLKIALSGDEAVTIKGEHVCNLAFNKNAFVFINRPIQSAAGATYSSVYDPITGINLRLKVREEYNRTAFEFDALWGGKVIRPEYLCRVVG